MYPIHALYLYVLLLFLFTEWVPRTKMTYRKLKICGVFQMCVIDIITVVHLLIIAKSRSIHSQQYMLY